MKVKIRGLTSVLMLLIICVPWLIGIVLSNGFWSCLFAMCIPPYAWYLVVEKVMVYYGMIE